MPCSTRARKTPTWAMPRAAPPESANPIFMIELNGIQCHNLRTFPRLIEKRIRVRLNLRFHQRLLNLVANLLQRRHDTSRYTGLNTRRINISVVISNLLLAYY